ncbi:MAG: hypothetical protein SGI77_20655 [Pirellulaceae bacterium]|nr:hypothetical protein [Pirellulaceae bacterium]
MNKKRRALLFRKRQRRHLFEQLEPRQMLTAGLDPVVLIPGFGGSFALDQSPAGLTN